MFRNYLATALRNLARNRLFAAINIIGLGVGMAAALLIGLYVRAEVSWDRFVPFYDRTYVATTILAPPGRAAQVHIESHHGMKAVLQEAFPEIEAATRLTEDTVIVRRPGRPETRERIYYADANAFDVLRLPVLAGDIGAALARPDGLVLTRSLARRHFGQDAPLGETLEVERPPGAFQRDIAARSQLLTVMAVLEDLPATGTQFALGMFVAGGNLESALRRLDAMSTGPSPSIGISVRTYFRLAVGADIAPLRAAAPGLWYELAARLAPQVASEFGREMTGLDLVRLDRLHLYEPLNPGIAGRLVTSALIAALVLLIAVMNFVNLSTARAARRAAEVGVRKASGAGRPALVLQFMGESLAQVGLSACIAIALVEIMLPQLNRFLNAEARLDYGSDTVLAIAILVAVLLVGVLAAFYPALVLSAFRPAFILRGAGPQSAAGRLRSGLVTLQFAILIGLMLAAGVIYQQRIHATRDALRVAADQMLVLPLTMRGACTESIIRDRLREVPGVRSVHCANHQLLAGQGFNMARTRDGSQIPWDGAWVEPGLLAALGISPLAGSYPEEGEATRVVVNETAARRFGFASPAEAIGQTILDKDPREIAAVVPDFLINTLEPRIKATVYLPYGKQNRGNQLLFLKLAGDRLPEALAAIDRVWSDTQGSESMRPFFLDRYIQDLFLTVLRQADLLAIFAGLAVVLSGLGLAGLAATATEQRTKEIGIRKAMGAGAGEILTLLLWQFAKPVLRANLIAWPAAFFVMRRWLQGFAYHIQLEPWMFLTAGAVALVIALATVAGHSLLVARTRPVLALRYE